MAFFDLLLGALVVMSATCAGAAVVFAVRKISDSAYSAMLAFAAGVMAYTVVEMASESHNAIGDMPVVIGFAIGVAALALLDRVIPHMHAIVRKREIEISKKKAALLAGAITIHNVPEGLAIASAFAASSPLGWFVASSMALQDVPEGLVVSVPLACYGVARVRSLAFGVLSGVVEATAAVFGYLFLSYVSAVTPFALAFSSGAMAYVIVAGLLPDAVRGGRERVAALFLAAGLACAFGIAALLGI